MTPLRAIDERKNNIKSIQPFRTFFQKKYNVAHIKEANQFLCFEKKILSFSQIGTSRHLTVFFGEKNVFLKICACQHLNATFVTKNQTRIFALEIVFLNASIAV